LHRAPLPLDGDTALNEVVAPGLYVVENIPICLVTIAGERNHKPKRAVLKNTRGYVGTLWYGVLYCFKHNVVGADANINVSDAAAQSIQLNQVKFINYSFFFSPSKMT
jgi:hypothetical protein